MSLMTDEKMAQVKEALEKAKAEVVSTNEYCGSLSKEAKSIDKQIRELKAEYEGLSSKVQELRNLQRSESKKLEDLNYTIADYEKALSDHNWEMKVRNFVAEYDDFYTFLEREVDKEQKRIQESSPQRLDFVSPAETIKRYKDMVNGNGISHELIEMRSYINHYKDAIRNMATIRANNRRVSIEELGIPLRIVQQCVASKATTNLWYR